MGLMEKVINNLERNYYRSIKKINRKNVVIQALYLHKIYRWKENIRLYILYNYILFDKILT